MRWLLALFLTVSPAAAAAQEAARLPTKAAAAEAYVAHEQDLCAALIDVCDGVPAEAPEAVEALACRPGRDRTARCTFDYAGKRCRAWFRRSNAAADGWVTVQKTRARKHVECSP